MMEVKIQVGHTPEEVDLFLKHMKEMNDERKKIIKKEREEAERYFAQAMHGQEMREKLSRHPFQDGVVNISPRPNKEFE